MWILRPKKGPRAQKGDPGSKIWTQSFSTILSPKEAKKSILIRKSHGPLRELLFVTYDTTLSSQRWQEGWLSPTERASASAISLRHIIWLPHESDAGMSLRVQAFGYVKRVQGTFWLPLDNRDKFYMDGKRIQCLAFLSNASQHVTIYLQPFHSNWTRKFAILAHFCLPWVRPWDNRGKCYITSDSETNFQLLRQNQAYKNNIPILLQLSAWLHTSVCATLTLTSGCETDGRNNEQSIVIV